MLKVLVVILISVYFSNCIAQTPEWKWAKSASGTGYDEARTVATDTSGNAYIAGYFSSQNITFDTITLNNSSGYSNIFLTKYSPDGGVLWAKTAVVTGDASVSSISVDTLGNIFCAGSFQGQKIIFGNTANDTLFNSDSIYYMVDFFLVKYDINGDIIWAKSSGGYGNSSASSVAVDPFGNVCVAGRFFGSAIIFGTDTLPNDYSGNIFMAKYDTFGNVLWAKSSGGFDNDQPSSVAIDANGSIYMTGKFEAPTIIFDTITLTNTGISNFFLTKYDQYGNVLWAKKSCGSSYCEASSVKVDLSGNLYLTGVFNGQNLTFDSYNLLNSGMFDIFLIKYTTSGNVIWAKNAGGTNFDFATSLAIHSSGNIYIAGWYISPTLVFGNDTLTHSGSINDIFLAKYSPGGISLSATHIDGGSADFDNKIVLDERANNIAGYFQCPSIYFGNITINNTGAKDIFLAKFEEQLHADAGSDISIICGETSQLNATSDYTGAGNLSYLWSPSSGLNNDTIFNPTVTALNETMYYLTITTSDYGIATDSVWVYISPLPSMEICYVEFDSTSLKNNIEWGTNLSGSIDTINIYNEVSTNVWELIGAVSANLSHFIDTSSNPFNQSYSYKISLKDICGNESGLSEFHTTISLLSAFDLGTDTYGFTWSAYQGLAVSNYYLYGLTSDGTEYLIGSVPGNQYFYNYTNPYIGFVKYFIGFNTPVCAGKTNHLVKSNFIQSNTSIEEYKSLENLISIFPTPVSDILYINTPLQIHKIEINDITGKNIATNYCKAIDCSMFENGVYFIKLYIENKTVIKKFMKQ